MKKIIVIICILFAGIGQALAQQVLKLKVIDEVTKAPLTGAYIKADGTTVAVTDSTGFAVASLASGKHNVEINTLGYKTQIIDLQKLNSNVIIVSMMQEGNDLEEVTLIASTRNNQSIENNPLKVEVLGKEEINEEVGIKPGNIASLLGDVSGVQIQQSSAVSGNSNVRIQGLSGRYTQLLRDGMPLYDGFSGGFGILTVPPLDLKQIELIKGAASTLYGGGAIAGLVNLISKRPSFTQEADVLVNYTTLTEFNINTYLAKRYKKVGYTLFAGYTHQDAQDVDKDGLSDVPGMSSFLVHPKVFFYPSSKVILTLGYSGTFDDRKGGDMLVLQNEANSIHQYFEQNKSARHTGEYSFEYFPDNDKKLIIKGLVSSFEKNTLSNIYNQEATQLSYYNEASLYIHRGKGEWVAGIDVLGDQYKAVSPDSAQIKSITNTTIGGFAQYSYHIKENTTVEAGLRLDIHNSDKPYLLPRMAFFHRIDTHWGLRGGFGMGYKTPDPFAAQDIEYNPLTITYVASALKSELSYGYNLEINYKKDWDAKHSLFINHAFFLTKVNNALVLVPGQGYLTQLVNVSGPLDTKGFDTYMKLTLNKWELYGGYTYTLAHAGYLPDGHVPLTPKNRMAFIIVREIEKKWRIGLENSLIGSQYRYNTTSTPAYLFMALMVQRNLGKRFSLVMNCENLLDYRMTRVDSVYTGSITNPDFKPLWAPVDGRVINLSVRWKM